MTIPREQARRRIAAAIEENRDRIVDVAMTVQGNPEIAYEEFKTAELLSRGLEQLGLKIEKPFGGMETAFRATRQGKTFQPTVAVVAHYDALPGLGHGCGHDLIAASAIAAAVGLNAVIDDIDGTFQILGTPAEEILSGKVRLAERGVFDGLDACLMLHHGGNETMVPNEYPDGVSLALARIDLEYFGQTAHAGADPHNGRNALNGVIKFFNGVDALRQHVPASTRLHGIISHGGDAPNVVPGYAAAKYYIREESIEQLKRVLGEVKWVAEGAALMTQTEVKITEHEMCEGMLPNYEVGNRYLSNMEEAGLHITTKHEGRASHSSDFGTVSHLMPAVMGFFAISDKPIPGHSQEVIDACGTQFAYDQLIKMSTAMSWTAFDLLTDVMLRTRAKREFQNQVLEVVD